MSNFWYINKYHLISLIIAIGVFFIPIKESLSLLAILVFLISVFCLSVSHLYDFGNFNNNINDDTLEKLEHFQYDKIFNRLWLLSHFTMIILLIIYLVNIWVELSILFKICYSLLAFGFVENLILFIFLFKIYKRGAK